MISPQDNPSTAPETTTQRGFVPAEERAAGVPLRGGVSSFVSYGAVISGMLLTVALIVLSSSFAYACGVPAFSGGAYGWGAGVWSCISAIIVFFCGGCLAAYMATSGSDLIRFIHGPMVWALTLTFILLVFGGSSLVASNNLMALDVTRMTVNGAAGGQPTWGTLTGAAWGAFISLVLGLLAASAGGLVGSRVYRTRLLGYQI